VPAGSFARFVVQVPNELDNADTTKVAVKLPKGLLFVSFQSKPGWKRTITTAKLSPPITVEGETTSERIATVTWQGGKIRPGEFDEFGLSAKVPAREGTKLTFPAVQTYSNGEVVHWIGPPDADEPAPQVTLEAAAPEAQPVASTESSSDDGHDGLAIGLAVAGLALGLVALAVSLLRRRRV
jgi:periplasmic copper chaperone A